MRYFSMFSGIGGAELGIEQAFNSGEYTERGENTTDSNDTTNSLEPETIPIRSDNRWNTSTSEMEERWDKSYPGVSDGSGGRPYATCIGYSEIDKYAIQTYEKHFKHTNFGDATKIDTSELPGFDFLIGGFPCQAFSVAGKKQGFNDTRGTLFFEIARILNDKKPRHFVLENVKGLLGHDTGKTFQTILGVLSELGYRVEWQILNSKDFGVPQNRERVYLVGHLRGDCERKVFPLTTVHQKNIRELNKPRHSYYRLFETEGIGPTLRAAGGNKPVNIAQGIKIRKLTPRECERLQGFPDDWTVGSDTQRYKQCGNAMTVNVVQAVITELKEHL